MSQINREWDYVRETWVLGCLSCSVVMFEESFWKSEWEQLLAWLKQFGTYIEATRIILKSKSKDRVIIIEVLAWCYADYIL